MQASMHAIRLVLSARHPQAYTQPTLSSSTPFAVGKILRDPVLPLPKQYSVELQFLTERLLEKPPAKRPTAKQVGRLSGGCWPPS
jgi:hypothetical protein